MEVKEAVEVVMNVVAYCAPFSFVWAVTTVIYDFVLRQVAGKGGNI